jgi:integrase
MLLIRTHNITVKLRYYVNNNGQNYFQRAIPKNLQRFFENKRNISHKLPSTHAAMLVEIERLARHYDQHFRALKNGEGGTPQQIQDQAVALLAAHGVLPGWGNTPAIVPEGRYAYPHLDSIEDYIRDKKADGTMTKVDLLAEQLLTKPMPVLLSQAPQIYFDNHENGKKEKFKKETLKRWKKIYSATGGDIPIVDLTREMAKRYVSERTKQVKTTAVAREISTIRAVLNVVIKEKGLNISNHFEGLKIPNKGRDSVPRKPFTKDEYRQLIRECITKGDEIRTLILLTCLTGARPGEIAGIRREDLFLDEEFPHFDLVEYADRTLKTKNSTRKVPLVPLAVNALKTLLKTHDETAAFPRYCDGNEVFGDNVSGATRKYIASIGIKKTLYSARHTVKTLLDRAGVSEYLAEVIGGWGEASLSRGYGDQHSIAQKYEALEKALSPILENINQK